MAKLAIKKHGISIRQACVCLGVSESCYRYQATLSRENAVIADWLLRLTTTHRRWGFGLCFLYLRNVKGFGWNHKRVYRIYRELELNLRIKPKRRIKRDKPEALSPPTAINQVWSMDFMSDSLSNGRSLRTFNVIDDYNRECLAIDVDLSMPSIRVIRSLERNQHKITLLYIQPGKPTQNAYVERFNRTARHEWLDMHHFDSVEQAQSLATQWQWLYNNERPNMAIGGVPPRRLLMAA